MRSIAALWAFVVAAAACGGDAGRTLTVDQYAEVEVPGVTGATLLVGDIEVSSVSQISIKLDGVVIAKSNLRRGDELPFVVRRDSETRAHVLTVVSYEDRLVTDRATLRIEDRRPSSTVNVHRIGLGVTAISAAIKLTVEAFEPPQTRITIATPTSNASRMLALGEPLTFEVNGTPYALEVLSFDGPAAYVRVAPRRR